ncbi:hypothetical protein DMA11_22035, partial [Marinilabiliaceae bacterium JC017]
MKHFYSIALFVLFAIFSSYGQAPAIESYSPERNTTNVPIDQTLILTFDVNIQPKSEMQIPAPFVSLHKSDGTIIMQYFAMGGEFRNPDLSIVSPDIIKTENKSLIISPESGLEEATTYYVTIDNGAIESTTNVSFPGLTDPNDWRFTSHSSIPIVNAYLPLQNSSNIETTTNLVLTFDQEIKFNSTPTSHKIQLFRTDNQFPVEDFLFYNNGTNRPDEVSITPNNTLVINPINDLIPGIDYYIIIENGAIESSSVVAFEGFSDPLHWTFSTGLIKPIVMTYLPEQNASNTHIDTNFELTFDLDIQFNSTATHHTINLYQDGIPSPIETFEFYEGGTDRDSEVFIVNDKTLRINPISDLNYNTTYYFTIDNGAIEATNSAPYDGFTDINQWRFTTHAAPPQTNLYLPLQNAINIDLATNFELTFDQPVQFNTSTALKEINIYDAANPLVPIIYYYISDGESNKPDEVYIENNDNLIINLPQDLQYQTTYFITIEDGTIESAENIHFSGFSDPNHWRFTTIAAPLLVTSYLPTQDASDVGIATNFELTFNKDIQYNSTGVTYFIKLFKDGNPIPVETFEFTNGIPDRGSEVSISGGKTLVLNPDYELDYQSTYYITVDAGAIEGTDATIFQGFSESTHWRFTTTVQPPQATTYLPTQNATNVDIATNFELTFDKTIQFNSTTTTHYINIYEDNGQTLVESFEFSNGTNNRDTEVSISGGNKLVINPDNNLTYGTPYYITVDAGAIEGTDATIFQGFSESTFWQFTTIQQPVVTTYLPTQNATDVAISTNFELTFDKPIQFNSTATTHYINIYEDNGQTLVESFEFADGTINRDTEVTISGGNKLVINPDNNLTYGTPYYITVDAGAIEGTDATIFQGFSESTFWRFTTIQQPLVTTYLPSQNATDVAISTNFELTFDKPIQFNS